MAELRKGGSRAAIVGAVLAVLLASYIGAYYVAVVPNIIHVRSPSGRSVISMIYLHEFGETLTGRAFRCGVFVPAGWLDRRIRPHAWRTLSP